MEAWWDCLFIITAYSHGKQNFINSGSKLTGRREGCLDMDVLRVGKQGKKQLPTVATAVHQGV